MNERCPLYFKDLPRTMTRQEYRLYSWWLRKTWRENKDKYEQAFLDVMIYGTTTFKNLDRE